MSTNKDKSINTAQLTPAYYPWQNAPYTYGYPGPAFMPRPLCETLNRSTSNGPRFIKANSAEFIPDDWVIGGVYRIQQFELGSHTEFKMNNLAFLQEKSPEKLVFMTISQNGETATITITAEMMCDNQPIAIFSVQ